MIKCAALLFICPSKILCIPHQTANSIFMDSAILCVPYQIPGPQTVASDV